MCSYLYIYIHILFIYLVRRDGETVDEYIGNFAFAFFFGESDLCYICKLSTHNHPHSLSDDKLTFIVNDRLVGFFSISMSSS